MRYLLLCLLLVFNASFAFNRVDISQIIEGHPAPYIPFCTPSFTCNPDYKDPNHPEAMLTIIYPPVQHLYIFKDTFGVIEILEYLEKGEVRDFTIEDHQTFNLTTGRWE